LIPKFASEGAAEGANFGIGTLGPGKIRRPARKAIAGGFPGTRASRKLAAGAAFGCAALRAGASSVMGSGLNRE
jgi:hypothetical protein